MLLYAAINKYLCDYTLCILTLLRNLCQCMRTQIVIINVEVNNPEEEELFTYLQGRMESSAHVSDSQLSGSKDIR